MDDFYRYIGKYASTVPYSYENEFGNVDENLFYVNYDRIENFVFLVGFQKTATSTLSSLLHLHDEVCLPIKKEPFFFPTDEFDFGMGFYWKKYFSHYSGQSTILDAATSNSYLPYAPKRIYDKIPNAKIIISLRNPIDRAYSNWWMYKGSGEENLSFKEAVEWELHELENNLIPCGFDDDFWKWYMRRHITRDKFIRNNTVRTYLTRSYYAAHIKNYLEYFPRKQIYFVFQEDMKKNKEDTFDGILSFLNLGNDGFRHDILGANDYHKSKNSLFLHKISRNNKLKTMLPDSIKDIGSNFINKIDACLAKRKMDESTRNKLVCFYKDKNKELEDLLGLDLSHWNK